MHKWGKKVYERGGSVSLATCAKCGAYRSQKRESWWSSKKGKSILVWVSAYKIPGDPTRYKKAPPCAASSKGMTKILGDGEKTEHDGTTILGLPSSIGGEDGVHLEISPEGKIEVVAFNEGGHNSTRVDVIALTSWMAKNTPIALLRMMANLKKHEGESKDFVRRNAYPVDTATRGSGPVDMDAPLSQMPLNGLLCSVCRLPQYDTPSGPSCANGHGGVDGVKP